MLLELEAEELLALEELPSLEEVPAELDVPAELVPWAELEVPAELVPWAELAALEDVACEVVAALDVVFAEVLPPLEEFEFGVQAQSPKTAAAAMVRRIFFFILLGFSSPNCFYFKG